MAKLPEAVLNTATNVAFSLNDLINVIPADETDGQLSSILAKLYREACLRVNAHEEAGHFAQLQASLAPKPAPAPVPVKPIVGRQLFRPALAAEPKLVYPTVPAEEYTDDMKMLVDSGKPKPAVTTGDPDMIDLVVQNMRPQLEKKAEERYQLLIKQHGLQPANLQPKCAR